MYQRLQIFRPCISKSLTQDWGENRACIRANGSIYGVPRGKSCPGHSFYQSIGMQGHNGIDIGGPRGQEIYHAATFNGWWRPDADSAGGLGVDIVSNEPLFFPFPIPTELIPTATPREQNGVAGFLHYVKMRYWHLDAQIGHTGKQVTCGTVVGLMGNTGASSNTHLHFAPKWCIKDGRGVGQGNGYFGAFDPNPYYNHTVTAKEHAQFLKRDIIPLSQHERQDMLNQLGLARTLLLALQEFVHKL